MLKSHVEVNLFLSCLEALMDDVVDGDDDDNDWENEYLADAAEVHVRMNRK